MSKKPYDLSERDLPLEQYSPIYLRKRIAELEAEVGDLTARCYSLLSFVPDAMMVSEVRNMRDQMVAKLVRAEAAEAKLTEIAGLERDGYCGKCFDSGYLDTSYRKDFVWLSTIAALLKGERDG